MNKFIQRSILLIVIALVITSSGSSQNEPFIGEIILIGFNFAPTGYADCNGQLLSIAQNQALFSLLGTTYGGDGITNFALPNLNDRIIIGVDQGPGLSNYSLGQTGGEATHTLTLNEMPFHTHLMQVDTSAGIHPEPGGNLPAANAAGAKSYSLAGTQAMAPLGSSGGSQPHNNMMPYLGMHYVIALQGIFHPATMRLRSQPTNRQTDQRLIKGLNT